MCNDIEMDEVLFPYDDWYDDDYPDDGEPDVPGCGRCYDTGWVDSRLLSLFGRDRLCPSCNPGWLRRVLGDVRWRVRARRNRGALTDEAPF